MFKKYHRPLKFILNSFRGHKGLLYIFFLGKIIEGFFYVVLPILAKLEIDQLAQQNTKLFNIIELNSFNIFLVILCIIFAVKLLEKLLRSFIDLFQYDFVKLYDNCYSSSLYNRLQYTEPGIFLNSRNKRFINEIIGDSAIIGNTIRGFIGDLITNIFVIIGIFTVLSLLNIWIFVVLFTGSLIMYFLEKIREKIRERQDFEEQYEYHHKLRIITEQLGKSFSHLLASGGFFATLSKYNNLNGMLREKIKERQKGITIISVYSFITENIGEILIKLIVGWSIFFAGSSIGTMTMTIMYVSRINTIFGFLRMLKFSTNNFVDNLKKLDVFLDITEPNKHKTQSLENFRCVSFENVVFSYPNFAKYELKYLTIIEERVKSYGKPGNHEKDTLHMIEETKKEIQQPKATILNDINLSFEKGKTYGIVGKNGAGKTTIISLLQNFFENYSGKISIDTTDIKTVKRDFFEANVSVINQIPYIIKGFSVRENLMLGVHKEYNDTEIYSLLSIFGLDKKIKKYRKGLDSKVGYDNDFSGGEKQLLTLTRIILQDKSILIMDEGTNQLDAENELKVMNELLKNKQGKIVIFITHRMTTIKKADMIYCLEDGKIEASGTHSELLKSKNVYRDFWDKQVGG